MNPLEVAQQILEEELDEDAKALFKKNRDENGVKGSPPAPKKGCPGVRLWVTIILC